MSKYDRFFQEAAASGIKASELYISDTKELSFSLFHNEIVEFSDNSSQRIIARGLVGDKFGSASSHVWSNEKCHYLVEQIKANGEVIEADDPAIIFEGSPKYKKVNTYAKTIKAVSTEEKIAIAQQIEAKIRALDPRIVEVEGVQYSESEHLVTILNSKGLKLNQKTNYFVLYAGAVASENGQVKSNYELFFGQNPQDINIDEFAKKVVDKTVAELGGEACPTGSYKVVLAPNVAASLLMAYLSNASAEDIQKKSSLFIGKLDQAVASKKLTVEELPLAKTVFARSFDDEGVATFNKKIVDKGLLRTYIYDLASAKKENIASTGNGYRSGQGISAGFSYLAVKPGKLSQDELFAKVGNGVYITSVQGLHAGLNAMSGNFSLQSTGFLIKDGKLDHGLDLVTVSGNLGQLFMAVEEVGSDAKLLPQKISCPSLVIKKLNISGK